MIRPAPAFMVTTAVIVVPLCTIAGLYPTLAPVCYGGLALFAALAAADAIRIARSISGWSASTPLLLRWFKDRAEVLPIAMTHITVARRDIRLHVALPNAIETTPKDKIIAFQLAGPGVVELP